MSGIRRCSTHGYFAADACPDCGTDGEHVLSHDRRRQVSKFMSGALRHFPEDVGVSLDAAGWVDAYEFADRVQGKYGFVDARTVAAVVATDRKGRFEVDGNRIRAAYGHSVDVDLEGNESPVPDVLYHGTDPETVPAIFEEGLQPMSRQHVHLTDTVAEARSVGDRHATTEPVVLRIDAAAMQQDGYGITKRGSVVYTTDSVPPMYIERLE